MNHDSSTNKRMAKNTILMYIRMLVLIIVQLYTVPIVLHALGVEDYGINNVVCGFVAMFTFVNGSLVSGSERFMAYAIGKNDENGLKEVFESSVLIFLLLSIVLFVLLETFGVWFLNTRMTIPLERLNVANWILQMSILSMIFTVLTTPYNAVVIAHEKMSVYAYASIFESFYKLIVAFYLSLSPFDKLITYSFLSLLSHVFIAIFYISFCKYHFQEAKQIKMQVNSTILKEIGCYSGWNVVGSLAIVLRNNGLNVVMNIFFTPIMNAAHAIAAQISGVLNQFVTNVYIATRPQMVKQYAMKNINEMWLIIFRSGKLAFFLLTYILVPILIELPLILKLWLNTVPDYTVVFCRLMLISLALETMVNQIIGAFQAANKIKLYQSVSSVVLLIIVPLSYIVLQYIRNPIIPYFIYVIISIGYILSLLIVASRQIGLDPKIFFKQVILKDFVVFIPSLLLTYIMVFNYQCNYWRILLTSIFSLAITSVLIWTVGADKSERRYFKNLLTEKLKVNLVCKHLKL